jgi:REP element-mobilizing transposase RayT
MPQSIFKMFAHIIFSTKNRADLIHPEIEDELFGYIHEIVENNKAKLIIANGTTNHIHLLVSLPKKIDIPELIGDVKRDSSSWVKKHDSQFSNFYWQRGYGAFSVGQLEIDVVKNYIANQKEHHKDKDFKTEYRGFLNKYEVEYDEQYVWD